MTAHRRWLLRDLGILGLVALLTRLAIVFATPSLQAGDMEGWEQAARRVTLDGIGAGYASLDPGSLYPPAFFYPLWLTGQLYRTCCSADFVIGTPTLDVLMRLGPVVADALLGMLVYALARTWTGGSRARWAGLLYALCPAVLVNVAQQGMIGDPYIGALVVLALLAALRGRGALSAACLALAVLTKPQALALVPLGALVLIKHSPPRERLLALGTAALVAVAVLLPFALAGTLGQAWAAVSGMANLHAYTQNSADNIWTLLPIWRRSDVLVGAFGEVPDSALLLPGISLRDGGLLAVGSLQLAMLLRLRQSVSPRETAQAAALLALGFFFLSTRMHVNYVFLTFPFLCAIAAGGGTRERVALVAVTLACLIDWQDSVPWIMHRANAALYGASLGMLAWGWLGTLTLRLTRERSLSAVASRRTSPAPGVTLPTERW